MNQGIYTNEEELLKKAINLLTEKLGPIETSRFLSISKTKRMESVKKHRRWQNGLNKDEFFKEIFK